MSRIFESFSFWHGLRTLALIIIAYLTLVNISEVLSYPSMALYFNQEHAQISWRPSRGEVDHYLLEITDARFLSDTTGKSALTSVKHVKSKAPFFQLKCEHNHSYMVRIKAVSPSGASSAYSEESTLFICDRRKPHLNPSALPSPGKVRSSTFSIVGKFEEPNLSSIIINGHTASINPADKSFRSSVTLDAGENRIDILAQDLAGNSTTKSLSLNYAPLTIVSFPTKAKLYWNGNYAYPGIYSGTTPQSYNQAAVEKQVIRLSFPGFNDYFGIIDFSDMAKDTYTIFLQPFSPINFTQTTSLMAQGKELEVGTHSRPFVVDYNLDGKKDLLLGTKEGTLALFTNMGSDGAPVFSKYQLLKAEGKDIDVGTFASPFVVDYNNDGAYDLLVGNGDGSLFYYANQGDTTQPVFTQPVLLEDSEGLAIEVDGYCTPCVVDWNGDNKKDILLGSSSGKLALYLNQGSDSEPLLVPPLSIEAGGEEALQVGSFSSPFIADWNGDGKRDLLVGDGEGYVQVYLSSAEEEESQLVKWGVVKVDGQEFMVEGPAAPFLVDWNQDGKNELLIGSGDGRIHLAM